jgi:ligand-binding SRPBCC domain-containing protein
MRFDLSFESDVSAPPLKVWEWITSLKGISSEMRPFFRMSAPEGVMTIEDLDVVPGRMLFRSRVFLFGFIPVDRSDITLIEFEKGSGFVEESPMGTMKLWRHERRIITTPVGSRIIDRLAFEPETASSFIGWFIRIVFKHRHRVLRKKLDLR